MSVAEQFFKTAKDLLTMTERRLASTRWDTSVNGG